MTVDKRVIVLSGVGGAVDARRSIRIRTDAGAQIAERLGGIGRRVFVVGGDAKTIDVDLDLELDALGEDLMLWMSAEDERVRLVCPEGDAVVYVDRDNAERTLYCPVHDVPLERAPARGSVVIERRVDED